MPNAVVTDLLDAVVAELNTIKPTMSRPYVASRLHVPLINRAKIVGVVALVGSTGVAIESVTRSKSVFDYEVQVGILSSVKITESEVIDGLIYLVQQLADYFLEHRELSSYPAATVTGVQINPIYDPEKLENAGVFVSVLVLAVQVIR